MGTLNFGFSSVRLFTDSKVAALGGYKPRYQKGKNLCFDVLTNEYCADRQLRGLNLGIRSGRQRKRCVFSQLKSVASADKVIESDGSTGIAVEDADSYDAIVIGSGIGGLVAATQLAVKGAKVLVLEKYVIPGGSSGYYERDGYTFDVGASVMFGFSDKVS